MYLGAKVVGQMHASAGIGPFNEVDQSDLRLLRDRFAANHEAIMKRREGGGR